MCGQQRVLRLNAVILEKRQKSDPVRLESRAQTNW